MKKTPRLGILCLLLSVFLTQESVTAQQVILINGEPTKVILKGEDISTIITSQLKNYMSEYGQNTDDEFVKTLVRTTALSHEEISDEVLIEEEPGKTLKKKEKENIFLVELAQPIVASTTPPQKRK